jgi:branched-chain amino acid transport system permease protein
MQAVGIDTARHKAMAMAASGLMAGFAGILAAQHTLYISPELLIWTVSGEVLLVVILGGIGTLIGPVIGAIILVMMKHELSNYTDYWHMIVGLALIFTVLAGGRGVFGQIEYWLKTWHNPRNPNAQSPNGQSPNGQSKESDLA